MYRRYNLALIVLLALGMAAMLALSFWQEPLRGDLARIGFLSENEYGWHGQQLRFDPALVEDGRLDGRYDVVVLGDSFSRTNRQTWPYHFATATGLRVGVFAHASTPLDALLASPAMRARPLLFVFETVERYLASVLPEADAVCGPPPRAGDAELPEAAEPLAPETLTPDHLAGLSWERMRYLFGFLRANLMRLAGLETTEVRVLRLDRPAPFTSRRTDRMPVYRQDYERQGWDRPIVARLGCRAARLQAMAVRTGVPFLLMVAPDKTSAYADFLAPSDRTLALTPILAQVPGLALLRADLALQQAIASGVRDVYLPDDTHWGSAGAALAAQLVQRGYRARASQALIEAPDRL